MNHGTSRSTVKMLSLIFLLFMSYFVMNIFVAYRLSSFLSPAFSLLLYIFIFFLATGFVAVSIVDRFFSSKLLALLYIPSTLWAGTLMWLFSALLVLDLLRLFVPAFTPDVYRLTASLLFGFLVVLVLYALWKAWTIVVKRVTLQSSHIKRPVRIVQISDVHLGLIRGRKFLSALVSRVNALHPDIIAITGDLFDGVGEVTSRDLAPLKHLQSTHGAFFVTGNHDRYGDEQLVSHLASCGVTVLRDSSVILDGVQLIGVGYQHTIGSVPDFGRFLQHVRSDLFSVLLYHVPENFADAAAAGVDLQLSGHTHKGQIFPFILFIRLMYRYTYGLYSLASTRGRSSLYVTSGAGTWGPMMRFGSQSEIPLFVIEPEEKGARVI